MKNTIIFGLLVIIAVLGGWTLFSDTHEHDHDHPHPHTDHDHSHDIIAKEPVRADGTFTIVTSFYPLTFAAETLTEGLAEVINIGAGRDPHDVQLSTQDVLTMQQADLVLLQGADLEPWGDDMMTQLKTAGVPVLVATRALSLIEGGHHHDHEAEDHSEGDHAHEDGDEHDEGHHDANEDEHDRDEEHEDKHDHGAYDPHTWVDPVLFSQSVGELVEALETLDPENANVYEERGAALQAELTQLDTAYRERLSTCTLDEVITSHDAFSYLAARYNFTIHTIAGLSTQDTPSAETLAKLTEEAEEGVSAILLEENSVAAFGETLANETGLRTLNINPISYIVPEGDDYFSIAEKNLETFADALQCN